MKIKDLIDRRSCCERIMKHIQDATQDHGVVEIDVADATELEEFIGWTYWFLDDVIKNTEVFK